MAAYIREAIVHCTLGNSESEILASLQQQPIFPNQTFKFGKEERIRPYGAIMEHKGLQEEEFFGRLSQLILDVIDKSALHEEDLHECALLIGSTSMNIPCSETLFKEEIPEMLPFIGYGKIGEVLAEHCGIGGEIAMFLSACTSSASALLYAQRGIESGRFPRAIVLGFEFYNEFTISGFETLGLLSNEGCKPFDHDRSGIMLGEGYAAVVVDSSPNSGKFVMSLIGGENKCDISSPTSHNINGEMVATTIQAALDDAGVRADEVTLIKAHATGSYSNDTAEGNGLNLIFPQIPSVFALKPVLGHTLGGCGVIELAVMMGALKAGVIPPTYGFTTEDEMLGIIPTSQTISCGDSGIVLMNHFGFGGNGTALVVRYGREG